MLDTFNTGDLVLGDAYYGTYFLLADLMSRGVDAVFEQYGARKKTVDFRKGKRLAPKDHLVTYQKPKLKPNWISDEKFNGVAESITVREVKVGHKILITTILSPKAAHKDELKKLYQQRWHVEVDLRNLKNDIRDGYTNL